MLWALPSPASFCVAALWTISSPYYLRPLPHVTKLSTFALAPFHLAVRRNEMPNLCAPLFSNCPSAIAGLCLSEAGIVNRITWFCPDTNRIGELINCIGFIRARCKRLIRILKYYCTTARSVFKNPRAFICVLILLLFGIKSTASFQAPLSLRGVATVLHAHYRQ